MEYSEAQKRLMLASFALGQAQCALEDAEAEFKKALDKVEACELACAAIPSQVSE